MSKSKKNYPDPQIILDKYGADALRLYLISQGIVKGESMKFKEEGVKMIIQNIHIYCYNTLTFLKQMIPFYEQKYIEKFIKCNIGLYVFLTLIILSKSLSRFLIHTIIKDA